MYIKKSVYCRWADDECVGSSCNYAICIRRKLLPNGLCGLSVKRKTNKETSNEALNVDIEMNNINVRGKLLRRFREDDLI